MIRCSRILTPSVVRCVSSRLLIIEPVMGVGREFSRGNLIQLQSLVLYGGKDHRLRLPSVGLFRQLRDSAYHSRSTLPIIELVLR